MASYKLYARALLPRRRTLNENATLSFQPCFRQTKDKGVLWQCGYFIVFWAWCVGQGMSLQEMLEYPVDQGEALREWVVEIISQGIAAAVDDDYAKPIRSPPTIQSDLGNRVAGKKESLYLASQDNKRQRRRPATRARWLTSAEKNKKKK
jgi:hypothetical protein